MAGETPQEIGVAIKELRKQIEGMAPDQAIMEKCQKFLDTAEDDGQKRLEEVKKAEKNADELKERMEKMELNMSRKSISVKNNYREDDEYKFLNIWCKEGAITLEAKEFLRTDNDVQGGFLVPKEMDTSLIKKITEISNVRTVARVRTMASKSMDMPVRNTIPEARFEGEAEQNTESNSTYQSETMVAFRLTYTAPITQEMLMNAAFDMESEMMQDAAEAFAQKEGNKFILGTGAKQPGGIVSNDKLIAQALDSVNAGTISTNDIIFLQAQLKVGYNPVFMLNRRTLATLRVEKSGNGEYLWQPGINGVVSSTISGEPYLLANDMPDIAVNAKPVAYGDFLRGYTIMDRTGMSVIRDQYTLAERAIIKFTMNRWVNGQVILPEAIKLLNIKA